MELASKDDIFHHQLHPYSRALLSAVLFPNPRRRLEPFYLAGEIGATVLGRDRPGTLRRAVKCVLAKQKGQKFNSLEITKVVSKRFLGIPFMSVTGHSRHIQQGVGLVSAKDFVLRMLAAEAPESALGSGGERHHGEVATKQYVALTSSS